MRLFFFIFIRTHSSWRILVWVLCSAAPCVVFLHASFDLTHRPLLIPPGSLLLFVPFACVDPLTSTEAVDDSIPNFNPFLSHPVVDAVHLPVKSSDGVSSRTPSHEMFGGKQHFSFSIMGCCQLSPFVVFSLDAPFCPLCPSFYTSSCECVWFVFTWGIWCCS